MIGHLGINVPDLEVARRYYSALLPQLDFEPFVDADDQFAYMPAGGRRGTYLFFYPVASPVPFSRDRSIGLQHLAFMARDRDTVRSVHEWVVGQDGEVVHAPRVFPEYPQPYYATFWLDPFGIMLETVCHQDRDQAPG